MKMPKIQGNFQPLQDLLMKHAEAQILMAAIDLGIFTELKQGKSAEEVASTLGLDPGNTRHLLNALAAGDLLRVSEGRFQNTPLAEEFLVRGTPTYLGEYLKNTYPWYNVSPEMISRLVRAGPSVSQIPVAVESEELWELQARGSINYQRAGMVQLIVQIISSLPEYPAFSRMLDLGCGPGLMGIGLVLDHPTLHAVLYDQHAVATVAEESVREYGVCDRVTVCRGNYLTDQIGGEYDLILASMTLNFASRDLDCIISKLYAALRPGGILVTISGGLRDEGTKPESMVISMLKVNLSGSSFGMPEERIAGAMLRAGFVHVRGRSIFSPVGELDCEIAKK